MAKHRRVPRTLYVLPAIPDDLSPRVKSALALRNACATEGVCPGCGAAADVRRDEQHESLLWATFNHENGCPASDEELARLTDEDREG